MITYVAIFTKFAVTPVVCFYAFWCCIKAFFKHFRWIIEYYPLHIKKTDDGKDKIVILTKKGFQQDLTLEKTALKKIEDLLKRAFFASLVSVLLLAIIIELNAYQDIVLYLQLAHIMFYTLLGCSIASIFGLLLQRIDNKFIQILSDRAK